MQLKSQPEVLEKLSTTHADRRFEFLDGLRGVASLSVMIFHLYYGAFWYPQPIEQLNHFLKHGVELFFIISGFVITYSLRDIETWGQTINFAIRRHVRLDPPYWTILALTLIFAPLIAKFDPQPERSTFTVKQALASIFYLQDLLHKPSVLAVAWTLCLEVQFYLVLSAVHLISRRTDQKLLAWTVLFLLIGSLAVNNAHHPWFIGAWCYFGVGAIIAMWHLKKCSTIFPVATIAIFVLFAALNLNARELFGALAASVVFIGFYFNKQHRWLTARWLQYFGRISYSLYLCHFLVRAVVRSFEYQICGWHPPAALWFIVSVLASIGAAQLLHVTVEKPAVSMAARWKNYVVE